MGKPIFSVDVSGFDVTVTDNFGGNPDLRITRIYFGDGHAFEWDTPDQTVVTHDYARAGQYTISAMHNLETSIKVVNIGIEPPEPEQPSWLERLIRWIKELLGL